MRCISASTRRLRRVSSSRPGAFGSSRNFFLDLRTLTSSSWAKHANDASWVSNSDLHVALVTNAASREGRRSFDKPAAYGVVGLAPFREAGEVEVEHGAVEAAEPVVRRLAFVLRERLPGQRMRLRQHLEGDRQLVG